LRRGFEWRLISHLGLNYLSIVEGGREALQEILRLYDFTGDAATLRQIEGLTAISSGRGMARVLSEYGVNFCQGLQIAAEFDEEQYVGREVFLFACVLERFLALYSSINSFSQLTVRTRQRKGILKRWPPRSGEQILL
jgi:type VI secretion system protein ImpG